MWSSGRRLRPALLGVLFAFGAAPLTAQQGGAYFTSPMQLGVTRESKFIVDGVALDDNVLLFLPPTLSLLRVNPRGEVSLSYQPEIQAFEEHSELTALNHAAEFVFARRLDPRWTISAGDTFIATSDPSRRVVDSVLLLPRDRLTQNTFYLDLSRRFGGGTILSLRGDNTITSLAAPITSVTQIADQVATAGTASLGQRFARRHMLTISYSFVDSRPLRDLPPREEPTTGLLILTSEPLQAHSGALSYVYEGEAMALRLVGGLTHGRDLTYTGSAQLDQRLGRDATFSLVLQRNLSFFGGAVTAAAPATPYRLDSGLLPMSLFEAATVRLRGDLSRAITVGAEASKQHTFSDLTLFDVKSHFARLRVDYHVSRAFSLFGTAELYRQSYNEFVGVPLDWKRFGVGVTVAVSSRPNPLETRRRDLARRERRERRGEQIEDDGAGAPTGVSAEPKTGEAPRNQGDTDADNGTRY
jgi:hypothetical protein